MILVAVLVAQAVLAQAVLVNMKIQTKFMSLMLAVFVVGCSTGGNSKIRPPLMDDTPFTNFVPTVVTNEMVMTNSFTTITNRPDNGINQ